MVSTRVYEKGGTAKRFVGPVKRTEGALLVASLNSLVENEKAYMGLRGETRRKRGNGQMVFPLGGKGLFPTSPWGRRLADAVRLVDKNAEKKIKER